MMIRYRARVHFDSPVSLRVRVPVGVSVLVGVRVLLPTYLPYLIIYLADPEW